MKKGSKYKFQEGGCKDAKGNKIPCPPIVTNNPNDPRLKAYQDSMTMYNLPLRQKSDITRNNKISNILDTQVTNAWDRLTNLNGKHPEPTKIRKGNFYIGTDSLGKDIYTDHAEEYKKPIQPVAYQKQEPTLQKQPYSPTELPYNTQQNIPQIGALSNVPQQDKPYRVEYDDPNTGQRTHQMFANDKQGQEFQQNIGGNRIGYYDNKQYGGKIYKYENGGNTQDESDFFGGYLDQLMQQNNVEQPIQEDVAPKEEESDYIKGLRAYDDEQSKTSGNDELSAKFDKLQQFLDEKLSALDQRQNEADLYDNEDYQNYLEQMYDTKNEEVPFNPNGGGARNNVGNIKDVNTGSFRSFATPQQGNAALINQLRIYQTDRSHTGVHSNSTLYEAMAKYAPSSDHNHPKQYAEFIAKKLGISPHTPIKNIDPQQWASAIKVMEGNKNVGI